MAIFRCTKCGHLREVTNDYIGRSVNCPHCKHVNPIHDTLGFVQKVIDRYMAQYKELQLVRQQLAALESQQSALSEYSPEELENLRQQFIAAESSDSEVNGLNLLADIDIHNTNAIASEQQYQPVVNWFQQRKIQAHVNYQALDTTGFFDEIAIQLGDDYGTLKDVSEQIKHVQQKGYTNVKLSLSKKNQKQIGAITHFCRELYNYSFLAKTPYYQKEEKILRLTLQTAPTIVGFFNGEWMEWFVFMKLLEFFRAKQIPMACLRSFEITFTNEDRHELDVFFLIKGTLPLCIECKSGEFRQQIEKYSTLRKRLKLEKTQFLVCVIGLNDEQTQGLSSMYDVTFVNEKNFLQHVEHLIG